MNDRLGKTEKNKVWYKNLLEGVKCILKSSSHHHSKGKHKGARYVSYSSLIGKNDPHGFDGFVKITNERLEDLPEGEFMDDDDVIEFDDPDFDFTDDRGIDFKD